MTRDFILAEIRRVTGSGKPPGIQTFAKSTGIREYDRQRYWARWSDALAEAGYEPNKRSDAYSEEHLLEAVVGIVRESGRIPTIRELRIRRDTDPSLPRGSTIFTRLGGRLGLINRARQYASEHGYDDVAAVCDTALAIDPATSDAVEIIVATQGYVYMIKAGPNQYKIGRTNSPTRRHREVAVNVPYATKLVHSIATDDPNGIEAYWHRRFDEKRLAGTEFFKLNAADVAAFKRRKSM